MTQRHTPKPLVRALAAVALGGAALAAALAPNAAAAQLPPVASGFPTAQACTPGQLLHRQVGLERVTMIVHHNGRLYSDNVGG